MRRDDGTFFSARWALGRRYASSNSPESAWGQSEIEEVLLELPIIAEAAAIGVDDPVKGQKLVVFCCTPPGRKRRSRSPGKGDFVHTWMRGSVVHFVPHKYMLSGNCRRRGARRLCDESFVASIPGSRRAICLRSITQPP
ncbi:AMP-binding enzyme [Cupriavidus basilensis]